MYLYIIKEVGKRPPVKVGVSANVEKRLATLQTGNPRKLTLIAKIDMGSSKKAYAAEALIHNRFLEQHIHGEWFNYKLRLKRVIKLLDQGEVPCVIENRHRRNKIIKNELTASDS